MTYKLISQQPAGVFDVTPLTKSIRWGGDIRQAARRLEVDMVYSRDPNQPKYIPPLATWLMLKNNDKEILRTLPFASERSTEDNLQITSYTHAIYMLKSKHTAIFRETTAEAIVRQLCSEFGIGVENIPSTGVELEKLILRDMSIWDMCITALTEAMKRNGKRYQIRFALGKLSVIEKGTQRVRWVASQGSNLVSASYSESIEDMRNRILIVGDKDQIIAEAKDMDLIKRYGLLQELKRESNITDADAKLMAENVLKGLGKTFKEASVECLGIDEVEAGVAIELREDVTGLVGTFYVDADEHSLTNGIHTMRLDLNWTDEVATMEARDNEGE